MGFLLNPYAYGPGGSSGYSISAEAGALVLAGGAANLKRSLRMVAGTGALALSGGAATLTYISGYSMVAGTGALALAGAAASLKRSLRMPAAPGALVLTGGAATLTYTAGAVPFAFTATTSSVTNATTYTFSAVDIGAADTNRMVVVAIATSSNASSTRTVSSATIGGVSATVNVQVSAAAASFRSAHIISAVVPTGTTGDVVITMSGTMARMAIAVYRSIPGSTTPVNTNTVGGGSSAGVTSRSLSLNVSNGGFYVMAAAGGTAAGLSASSSGADAPAEDMDTTTSENNGAYGAYSASTTETATPTLTVDCSSGTLVIAAASWV